MIVGSSCLQRDWCLNFTKKHTGECPCTVPVALRTLHALLSTTLCPEHYVCADLSRPRLLLQVVKALTAADTAYSAVPSKGITDSSTLAGKDATLVALVQVNLIKGTLQSQNIRPVSYHAL